MSSPCPRPPEHFFMPKEPPTTTPVRNVLFIRSRSQWRSPTAEQVWRRHPLVSARSAGIEKLERSVACILDIE